MKRDREETNSVTHLVKIIAQEVYDENFRRIEPNITIDASEFLSKIHKQTRKAGEIWSDEEDEILKEEYRVAIAAIASNHQRTSGSIAARVKLKEL